MEIVRRFIEDDFLCQPPGGRKAKDVFLYCFVLITSVYLPAIASKKNEIVNKSHCQVHALPVKDVAGEKGDKNTSEDRAEIFQKCLDLPELQGYYPKNADGTYKQVYVMQTPISFPVNLAVSKFQQNVVFLARGDIYDKAVDAFLIFKDFSIQGDKATITYDFNYNYTSSPAALEMTITLQKIDNAWTVVDTKTNNR